MAAVVIVAIPRQDDYVWKISSQKVPHLTLCYLGEPSWSAEELANVVEYVEHASSLFHRVGLSVDRRGTLGDDEADVLFFEKEWTFKKIDRFRSNLLANDTINAAYRAQEQFDVWTPHLTLGYPDSPANPDNRDYGGIGWVEFDKIAVWTEEFDGPTFELKSEYHMLDMAMSSLQPVSDDDILEHYGVKGQKWGVRKKRGASSGSNKRTTFKKAPGKLSDAELAKRIKRMEIEKKYNDLNRPDISNGQRLVNEILSSTGRRVATTVLTGASLAVVRTALTSQFGESVAGEVTRRLK
jgi:2'-5' RNA ligase